MTKKTLKRIKELLEEANDGIHEYAMTLEDTDVIRNPLDEIWKIIEKEMEE